MATKTKTEELTVTTLTPSQLKDTLRANAFDGMSTFVWGGPGLGKSQIAKQVANEEGFDYFVDTRLSQVEPTDIRGIPMPVKVDAPDGKSRYDVQWSTPSFLRDTQEPVDVEILNADGTSSKTRKQKKAFFLFDEMNTAPQSVQAAAYQIVLDKAIGDHRLGPKDFVVACGNRENDKGATFKMPKPLQNRFMHVELIHDFEDWQQHAIMSRYNPYVIGFITWKKEALNEFDPTVASYAFATPRSWEFVSRIIDSNLKLSSKIQLARVAGLVGEANAHAFLQYQKNASALPNPTDILSGRVKDLNSTNISLMYSLTTSLCYELKSMFDAINGDTNKVNPDTDKYCSSYDNFIGYIMANFQTELVIMAIRIAIKTYNMTPPVKRLKNWQAFAAKFSDLILKA